ncbi:3-methyladenine DNA glycosylase 2, partial [Streptomyces sp. NPDC051098]
TDSGRHARSVLGHRAATSEERRRGHALVVAHGRPLCEPSGGLTHLFPDAATLADADQHEVDLPDARRAALRTLTTALADGTVTLDPGADRDEAERRLLALPGIDHWTAGYIRMRALGDPDVLLTDDPSVRAGMRRAGAQDSDTEAWRPWSSYAMHHFWSTP